MGLLDDAIREHLELKRRRGADPSEVARQEQDALGPVRRDPTPSAAELAYEDDPRHEPDVARAGEMRGEPTAASAPAAEPHDDLHDDADPRDDAAAIPATDPREHGEWTGDRIAAPREATGHADEAHVDELDAADDIRARRGTAASDEPIAAIDQPTVEYRIEDHDEATRPSDRATDADDRDADAPPHPRDAETDRYDTVERSAPGRERGGDDASADARGERSNRDAPNGERHEGDDAPNGRAGAHHEDDPDVLEETPDFLEETPEHERLWFEQRPPRDFDFDG